MSRFLSEVKKGVIHVGAHSGEERFDYHAHSLKVLWIEADTNIFRRLRRNIHRLDNQRCLNYLVSNIDSEEQVFNRSSRLGTSSIFDFKDGRTHDDQVKMPSRRMETLLRVHDVGFDEYDYLVTDVQGADLLVLEGMGVYLNAIEFLKVELYIRAPYVTIYKNDCVEKAADEFIINRGFRLVERRVKENTYGSKWAICYYRR